MENTIIELARACASHKDIPDALKQSIQRPDDQARQCHSRLKGAEDSQTFAEAIDKLEICSDHVKTARQNASGKVDHSMESAVMHAHEELPQLKHKLYQAQYVFLAVKKGADSLIRSPPNSNRQARRYPVNWPR